MKDQFSMAYLTEEFELAGEKLENDLSAVNLYLCKDVHYDEFEFEIFIFGKDGPDSAPIINHLIDVEELLRQQIAAEVEKICFAMEWSMSLDKSFFGRY